MLGGMGFCRFKIGLLGDKMYQCALNDLVIFQSDHVIA